VIAGDAALSAATSNARPGLRAAVEIAVEVRVAGSGPPNKCPTRSASIVTSTIARLTRRPAPTTTCQMFYEREHEQDHEEHAADAP
jgi:hypothetical protein